MIDQGALYLVWVTSRPLTFSLALLTLLMGALPGLRAAVTKRVVDAVVAGISSGAENRWKNEGKRWKTKENP